LSNNSDLDAEIEAVKQELRSMLIKRRQLVERLGYAFEKVVADSETICEEIKNCLKEEIAEKIISSRLIEQYCPDKWKRKTRPKLENEKNSFSDKSEEEPRRKITIDTQGNPVQEAIIPNLKSDKDKKDHYPAKEDFRQHEKGLVIQDHKIAEELTCSSCVELMNENKRIRNERDDLIEKLRETLQIIKEQKQKEAELQKKIENTNNQLQSSRAAFDVEFAIEYRPLQQYMASIYKSVGPQKVWFTVIVDANVRKVISVDIRRKSESEQKENLLQQRAKRSQ
jgi:hypothetical protein